MINSLVHYWPDGADKAALCQIVADNGDYTYDLIDRFGVPHGSVPATDIEVLSKGPPGLFKLGVKWNG